MIVDTLSDKGLTQLTQISNIIHPLPDFVKSASLPSQKEISELPATSFADVSGKRFPVHTKSAAYLSYAYFLKQQNDFDKTAATRIAGRFQQIASFWNMKDEFENMEKFFEKKSE